MKEKVKRNKERRERRKAGDECIFNSSVIRKASGDTIINAK
jgi:hypothetical protein